MARTLYIPSFTIAALVALQLTPLHAFSQNQPLAAASSQDAAKVAAVVNGKDITVADLDKELESPEMKAIIASAQQDPSVMTQLRANILRSMIDRTLMLNAAVASGAVSDSDIEKEYSEFVKAQGGADKLKEIVEKNGSSWTGFQKDMREGIRLRSYVEKELGKNVIVSDAAVRAAYDTDTAKYEAPEQVHARHVLISVPKGADDTAQKLKADQVYQEATTVGADFGEIASKYSDDPGSKLQGGDLGFFPKGVMVSEFEKTVFALKANEVAKPIRTQFGYHIIKLEEKKNAKKLTFDEAKESIKQELLSRERQAKIMGKLAELRKVAKIEYKMPELNQVKS